MSEPVRQRYSFAEDLELEETSAVKHEFVDGHVWAMAGKSPAHAAIAVNISSLLRAQLRGRPCRVFSSDLRVRVVDTGLSTYPEVTVVCDTVQTDPADARHHTVVNPRLVVEVLSPTTEDYERGEKLAHYKRVAGLEEIVLVAHDARRLEIWRRESDLWSLELARDDEVARLGSVGCTLPLAEVYEDALAGTTA